MPYSRPRTITLRSPFCLKYLTIPWQNEYEKNGASNIADFIRNVEMIPRNKQLQKILNGCVLTDYVSVKRMSRRFNKLARSLYEKEKRRKGNGPKKEYATEKQLKIILSNSYDRAIVDASKLNRHYPPFSSQVYGEISYDQIQSIIEEIKPKGSDVFIDLGCGGGNVVIQMAGGSKVKRVYGIEIADFPSDCAKIIENEFKRIMKCYNKSYRPFLIKKGDFMDSKFRSIIVKEATIIFINNRVFTPALALSLQNLLLSLKDGTKIITTNELADLKKKEINERTFYDLSAILTVSKLNLVENCSSWASKVPYYLHVVDRSRVEEFTQKFPAFKLNENTEPNHWSCSEIYQDPDSPAINGAIRFFAEKDPRSNIFLKLPNNWPLKTEEYQLVSRKCWKLKTKDCLTGGLEITLSKTHRVQRGPYPYEKTRRSFKFGGIYGKGYIFLCEFCISYNEINPNVKNKGKAFLFEAADGKYDLSIRCHTDQCIPKDEQNYDVNSIFVKTC